MTKTEAIKNLLECDWLEQACRNIGKHEWDELQQEFWVKILEQPESVFTNIRNLQFFSVRVIINAHTDRRRKSFRHTSSEVLCTHGPSTNLHPENSGEPRLHIDFDIIEAVDDIDAREYAAEMYAAITQKDKILGKLPMYDRVLFKLHERGVSCRKISEFTKINRKEVTDTVNRVKKHIQQNVRYQPGTN